MRTIGFIGAGNMATGIISGMVKAQLDVSILAYDTYAEKLPLLQEKYGIQPASSAEEVAKASDYLFLAVKPQNFAEALGELKPAVRPETVFVSIAAGIQRNILLPLWIFRQKWFWLCRTPLFC